VGHPTNLHYLRSLEPALANLARRYAHLTLRVVCSEPFESAVIPVENVRWSLEDEVANFRALDIGLMPLDDDPWTRGKCGYKALQYMAAGVPVVCSPVGMNVEIVTEGKTGLLAGDLSGWERQIARLVDCPALRQRLGVAGQDAALRDYSLSRMAPRLATLLTARAPAATRRSGETDLPALHPLPPLPAPGEQPQEDVICGKAPR
jgi:glycosyltransferase involved in cell wall biosynthesis